MPGLERAVTPRDLVAGSLAGGGDCEVSPDTTSTFGAVACAATAALVDISSITVDSNHVE